MSTFSVLSCTMNISEEDLFFPKQYPVPHPAPGRTDVAIQVADSVTIRGWFYNQPEYKRTVIYCYGNGSALVTSQRNIEWLSQEMQCNVLAMDYRGYGFSDGTPTLAALAEDGGKIYDYLVNSLLVEQQPILVLGRSIGTGMAIRIAETRPVQGVMLEAPPSSVTEVIPAWRKRIPGYLRWAVRKMVPEESIATFHPQPIESVKNISAPLLVMHGTLDEVIPIRFGKRIFDEAGSTEKEWCAIDGAGHDTEWYAPGKANEALRNFVGRYGALVGHE